MPIFPLCGNIIFNTSMQYYHTPPAVKMSTSFDFRVRTRSHWIIANISAVRKMYTLSEAVPRSKKGTGQANRQVLRWIVFPSVSGLARQGKSAPINRSDESGYLSIQVCLNVNAISNMRLRATITGFWLISVSMWSLSPASTGLRSAKIRIL